VNKGKQEAGAVDSPGHVRVWMLFVLG
jgi:hypothetical protein